MKGKILLVDDNLDMLLIGQRIFTRAGYDFISARTGQEGLDKAKIDRPDIIILDYMLPDITGSQFIKTLGTAKEYTDIKDTPIVILTARAEYIDDLKSCFALGLRAFLNKPFGHRELVNVIDNILQQSRLEKPKSNQESLPLPDQDLGAEWFDDLKTAASTIATLCRSLGRNENANLTEEQRMDLQAIYTSSKRLIRLISGRASNSFKDVRETYFT